MSDAETRGRMLGLMLARGGDAEPDAGQGTEC